MFVVLEHGDELTTHGPFPSRDSAEKFAAPLEGEVHELVMPEYKEGKAAVLISLTVDPDEYGIKEPSVREFRNAVVNMIQGAADWPDSVGEAWNIGIDVGAYTN